MNAAFIGLGVMGMAIAQRLQGAGATLRVWNRSPAKCAPLQAAGATVCPTPAEAAATAEIVFLCLMDGAAVEDVVFGEQGVALLPPPRHRWSSTIPASRRTTPARSRPACRPAAARDGSMRRSRGACRLPGAASSR